MAAIKESVFNVVFVFVFVKDVYKILLFKLIEEDSTFKGYLKNISIIAWCFFISSNSTQKIR